MVYARAFAYVLSVVCEYLCNHKALTTNISNRYGHLEWIDIKTLQHYAFSMIKFINCTKSFFFINTTLKVSLVDVDQVSAYFFLQPLPFTIELPQYPYIICI